MDERQNLAFCLKQQLNKEINAQISEKARTKLNLHQYFLKREELELKIINSSFPYAFFSETTLEQIVALDPYLIDKKTLMLIIIESLKSFVDNGDEQNPKCILLHNLYLKLKKELSAEIPFEEDDGFLDYLNARTMREQQQDARFSGSVCIFCGSEDVASYGTMWKCRTCGRSFRKHKN